MSLNYQYLYTCFHVFGSLPTHKVFKSETSNKSKLVFADNSFIYGLVSDWTVNNTDFYSGKPTWEQESELFLKKELTILSVYRSSHPYFKTEMTV
ncbi:hypothetical protein [Acinetobacter sp. ANC 4648]|uniref:hypothetical protein n=1 Tax=Acinetobacter sp. ANC 4648 TaxID=1977875 RepID=UPI000A336070|nr:hypothetical protein [Acinetobacter sp. ANC 4648]OTG82841.1 hypothetical protein B9T27_06095 [Acinetobacter sp. ANC 4648]